MYNPDKEDSRKPISIRGHDADPPEIFIPVKDEETGEEKYINRNQQEKEKETKQ